MGFASFDDPEGPDFGCGGFDDPDAMVCAGLDDPDDMGIGFCDFDDPDVDESGDSIG